MIEVLARVGGRGYTVSVVRRDDSRNLYLRWWDPARDNHAWESLGHDDIDEAQASALEMAALLKRGKQRKKLGMPLAVVLAEYEAHVTVNRKPGEQKAHRRRMYYFLDFFKANKQAVEIDLDALEGYIQHRREAGVSDTTIGHECVFLRGILYWAASKRGTDGKPLLPYAPLPARMKRLKSEDPNTPVAERWAYLAVRRYADRVDAQKLLRPLLILCHEHGWRLSEWLMLKANAFDFHPRQHFPFGRIRAKGENHKKGKGGWLPLTPASRRAAKLLLRRSSAIGEAHLLRAPKVRGPWQDQYALDLLHRTEALATEELRRIGWLDEDGVVELGGFHALRRKWATDRKSEPIVDTAHAGRWHPQTLLVYQKPDAETTLRVTLRRKR